MHRWMIAVVLFTTLNQLEAGEQYALLVGIDHVPDIGPEFDLKNAEGDVEQLKSWLVEEAFYLDEHVHLLKGSSSGQLKASKTLIQSEIVDEFARDLSSEDVLLIYLAMHGTVVKEGDETKRAFLPVDASKGRPTTYISDKELGDWLARVQAQKIVILDVCFAGGKGSRFFRDESNRTLIMPTFERGDPLARNAQAVITASGRDEPAKDGELARALGRALEEFSQTDRDRNNLLSAREIYEHIKRNISGQNPELLPGYREVAMVDGTTGYVTVETTPPGAEVWFGGELLGETPLHRRPVKAVTDFLSIRKEGFEDYLVAALKVWPGYRDRYAYELQQRMGQIVGRVVDEEGRGVQGAQVTLLGTAGQYTLTNMEGDFEIRVPFAQYTGVTVRASGFREDTFNQRISVDTGRPSYSFLNPLRLDRAAGFISITTIPSGTHVFIDGRLVGQAPLKKSWPTGKYELRLEAAGSKPRAEMITIYDQQETRREISLEQRTGLLIVDCNETDAIVYIDGQPTGFSLAFLRQGMKLQVGVHSVKVTKSNFTDFIESVTIQENETAMIQAELQRAGAFLSVRNVPVGTKVIVKPANGRELEFFGAIEQQPLPAGEVLMMASAVGFERWQQQLFLEQDEVKVLSSILRKRSRSKALMRSLVVPSWGQFYNQRPARGTLILLGTLGAAGTFIYSQMQYSSVDRDHQAAIESYNSATSLPALRQAEREVNTTFDDLDSWHELRRIGAGALVTLWGYGLLDALIAGPPKPTRLTLQPTPNHPGAALAWQF
jgi:hypothetical protein